MGLSPRLVEYKNFIFTMFYIMINFNITYNYWCDMYIPFSLAFHDFPRCRHRCAAAHARGNANAMRRTRFFNIIYICRFSTDLLHSRNGKFEAIFRWKGRKISQRGRHESKKMAAIPLLEIQNGLYFYRNARTSLPTPPDLPLSSLPIRRPLFYRNTHTLAPPRGCLYNIIFSWGCRIFKRGWMIL